MIVGHSERRTDHGESDADVNAKAQAAWRAGLVAIICVGEIKPRKIRINELELMNIDLPYIQLRVSCSKGTYIRSLAYDLGKALNSGAWLSDLKRTKIGSNTLNNALDIQAFQQMMK